MPVRNNLKCLCPSTSLDLARDKILGALNSKQKTPKKGVFCFSLLVVVHHERTSIYRSDLKCICPSTTLGTLDSRYLS